MKTKQTLPKSQTIDISICDSQQSDNMNSHNIQINEIKITNILSE